MLRKDIKYYILNLLAILLFFIAHQTVSANEYEENSNNDICFLNHYFENYQFIKSGNVGSDIENSKYLRPDFFISKEKKEGKGITVSNKLQNGISFQSITIIGISRVEANVDLNNAVSESNFSSQKSYIRLGGVECVGKVVSNAAKGVGLSDDVARTFAGGRYSKVVLDKPMTLSRYYDNVGAFAKGRYMTNPSSITGYKFADRMGLALKPQWNGMTKVANWNLPAGTTIYQGRAAMQFPWIGGRTQYFVPNLNNITRTIR